MTKQLKACAPIELTLDVIGGKWKPLIVYFLLKNQVMRFNELQRAIPAASRRMLTKHLRELEAHGMVHREVYAEVPPRVEYSLTELGYTLKPLLDTMLEWGFHFLEHLPAEEANNIEVLTPEQMQADS
ncbi:MAG: helix-turn-helix domain-containing protein [Chloroflexota bacterium]